jgi:hypothetical protein
MSTQRNQIRITCDITITAKAKPGAMFGPTLGTVKRGTLFVSDFVDDNGFIVNDARLPGGTFKFTHFEATPIGEVP